MANKIINVFRIGRSNMLRSLVLSAVTAIEVSCRFPDAPANHAVSLNNIK